MSSRLAQAALLTASVVLSLVAAEASLRFFFHAAPQLDLDIYRKQDGLLLLRPNLVRRHVTRFWDVDIRTNSEGWRDEEFKGGGNTALGMGDSFAFGWGVEAKESFYSLIEPSLRAELVNVGVPGASTLDEERLLETLIPRYRPRQVLLAFFVGNDFTETGLGGADRLDVVDGLLQLRPIGGEGVEPADSLARRLARKSRLLQLLRAVQFEYGIGMEGPTRTWDAWMREFAQVHLRQPSPQTQEAIRKTLESLDRIADRCRRDGIALAVVVIPRSFQVDDGEREEMRSAIGAAEEDLDMDRPQRLLRKWAERNDVLLVDPLERFKERHAAGVRLFYTPDAHLTPEGHRVVADALAAALAGRAKLGRP